MTKKDKKTNRQRHSILFIIPALYGGGAEKVCCLLASGLADANDVTLLYFKEVEDGRAYPVDPRVKTVLFPYRYFPFRESPLRSVSCKLRNIRALRKLKKARHVDIAVSLLREPNYMNVFSRQGERVVTSERLNPRKFQPEKFWQTWLTYALSDHVVFQSETVRSLYGRWIRRRSSIVMNPVSVSCPADPVRKKKIVTAGRLAKQKNHKMLIHAFAEFHVRFPDYILIIYGEGPERENLQKQIKELGLEKWISLPGNVANLHEQIRDAEIFVLSSDFEGLSNALLESMTMGIACISTRCEGSVDVIRDRENGLLVNVGDARALAESLCSLAADPELRSRLEAQAKKDVAALNQDVVIQKWKEVLFGQ